MDEIDRVEADRVAGDQCVQARQQPLGQRLEGHSVEIGEEAEEVTQGGGGYTLHATF